jgi:hypothetical protein
VKLLILPKGIMSQPIELDATLVLVSADDGTPLMVSGEYGPQGTVKSSHALDSDFHKSLKDLGINTLTVADRLVLPQPPPGAKIIAGPDFRG